MKKFDGMLFCTDLDGTLYCDDKSVSKENLDAIEYFKSEGGLFTFITGRVPSTSKSICDIIKPNAPFGCINGAGIYDRFKDCYLWYCTLPSGALELAKFVDENMPEIGIQLNIPSEILFLKDNLALQYFRKVTGAKNTTCTYESINEPLTKIVFAHHDSDTVSSLERLLKSHPDAKNFDFIRSERRLYEILPKGVSKGSLLCKMAELLGIDPNKTIAVGDYYNDVSMIKNAGLGFAVANAVDDAKAAADYITVCNNDSAIAAIVDGLDRGIYKF